MSWLRAAITSVVLVIAAVALLGYLPNALLTKLGLSRSGRVTICTAVFTVVLVLLLAGLRRLQSRRMI